MFEVLDRGGTHMRGTRLALVVGLGCVGLGCSSGALVGELAVPVAEQRAVFPYRLPDGGANPVTVTVALADRIGVEYCGLVRGFKGIAFLVQNGGSPITPGTYPVTLSPSGVRGAFIASLEYPDAGLSHVLAAAVDGGVTVTTCSGAGCAGSFQALMYQTDGGTSGLSGTFDAPAVVCAP
jgi:hypothetical protein